MARIKRSETNPGLVTGKVNSLLEGGYDTSPTLGLAKCVDAHVQALRDVDGWMHGSIDGSMYVLCESPLLFLKTNK